MKDSYLYTIVFIFVLSVAFVTVLAMTQAAFLPVITENELQRERIAILTVLNLPPEADLAAFEKQVSSVTVGDRLTYVRYDGEGLPVGFAVPIAGKGLWGSIRGYLGVAASFDRILALEFVEQNETTGLGGRIDESWFKEQFRDLPLRPGEELSYDEKLDAITGATSSSNAVLRITNDALAAFMSFKEVMGR
ncbi:MAG: FMN-binding protein [Firmicutes bacterium]|nr:FMN-binding protein [Bacillota bacterium]